VPAIGERLREARTRRGASIEDAENGTKIRARYLRALEDEQYDVLPGRTYVRTFLRSYGEWLGLDARLLVEEYRAQYEGGETEEAEGHSISPVAGRGRERQRVGLPGGGPGPLAFLGFGALAVILFFLVLGLTAGEQPREPSPSASGQVERKERESARRRKRARERSARRRERPATPRSVSLRVVPSEPTYVCVDDGRGNVRYEGTLTEARRFRGKRLRMNLGKTSAKVSQNGRRVPVDVRSADPVAYDFRPGKRRRLPLPQGPCA
jgi:cytoskeleton protein RodZ